MADRATVLKGLERFIDDFKPFCGNRNDWQRVYDALALLKKQEPRVMDAEEVARLTEEIYQWLWIEEIQNITWNLHCLRAFVHSKHPDTGEFYILANGYRDIVKLEGDEYGKTWRCWTARPTEEQRKAVKWDAEPEDPAGTKKSGEKGKGENNDGTDQV